MAGDAQRKADREHVDLLQVPLVMQTANMRLLIKVLVSSCLVLALLLGSGVVNSGSNRFEKPGLVERPSDRVRSVLAKTSLAKKNSSLVQITPDKTTDAKSAGISGRSSSEPSAKSSHGPLDSSGSSSELESRHVVEEADDYAAYIRRPISSSPSSSTDLGMDSEFNMLSSYSGEQAENEPEGSGGAIEMRKTFDPASSWSESNGESLRSDSKALHDDLESTSNDIEAEHDEVSDDDNSDDGELEELSASSLEADHGQVSGADEDSDDEEMGDAAHSSLEAEHDDVSETSEASEGDARGRDEGLDEKHSSGEEATEAKLHSAKQIQMAIEDEADDLDDTTDEDSEEESAADDEGTLSKASKSKTPWPSKKPAPEPIGSHVTSSPKVSSKANRVKSLARGAGNRGGVDKRRHSQSKASAPRRKKQENRKVSSKHAYASGASSQSSVSRRLKRALSMSSKTKL